MSNKDWTGNKNSIFKTLGASNHTEKERQNEDYYATDPEAAEWLLKIEDIPKDRDIWEPAAGELHLSNVFKKHGYHVRTSDLIKRTDNIEKLDFLSQTEKWDGSIITNPPYKCFSSDTECFTKNGWKYIIDVEDNDEILSLNPTNQLLEWSSIKNKIIRPFNPSKEKMYHFKKSHMDIMCTSEHRMYTHNSLNDDEGNIILSQDIRKYHFIPRIGYKWNGEEKDFFILPGVNGFKYAQPFFKEDIKIKMNYWLEFFGLWLADGYCRHTKNTQGNPRKCVGIKQLQSNGDMVRNILNKLPFKYKEVMDNYTTHQKNPCINFEINDEQLWGYLKQFGYSENKFIPTEFKNLSCKQINILLDSYFNGDGSHYLKDGRIYRTISKQLIEDIQELLLKLGYLSHITNTENCKYKRQDNTEVVTYSIIYNPHSIYNRIFYPSNFKDKCECEYEGNVACLTLNKNGVFLLRRNGKEFFSGNCAAEFVEKAMETVTDGNKVCMFLKLQFLEGKKRRELFKKYPPKTIWVSSSRIMCAKNGDFETMIEGGGSAVAYGWYCWEKGYKGDTTLKWFN